MPRVLPASGSDYICVASGGRPDGRVEPGEPRSLLPRPGRAGRFAADRCAADRAFAGTHVRRTHAGRTRRVCPRRQSRRGSNDAGRPGCERCRAEYQKSSSAPVPVRQPATVNSARSSRVFAAAAIGTARGCLAVRVALVAAAGNDAADRGDPACGAAARRASGSSVGCALFQRPERAARRSSS